VDGPDGGELYPIRTESPYQWRCALPRRGDGVALDFRPLGFEEIYIGWTYGDMHRGPVLELWFECHHTLGFIILILSAVLLAALPLVETPTRAS